MLRTLPDCSRWIENRPAEGNCQAVSESESLRTLTLKPDLKVDFAIRAILHEPEVLAAANQRPMHPGLAGEHAKGQLGPPATDTSEVGRSGSNAMIMEKRGWRKVMTSKRDWWGLRLLSWTFATNCRKRQREFTLAVSSSGREARRRRTMARSGERKALVTSSTSLVWS
jgi:hypothetical protein